MKFRKIIPVILAISSIVCICIISRIHYLSIKGKKLIANIETDERIIWIIALILFIIPTIGFALIYIGRILDNNKNKGNSF